MKHLSAYPTPIGGLCLGLAGLGALWGTITKSNSVTLAITTFAALLLLPLLYKFITMPVLLLNDLRHPTVGSVVPTLAMTLMLISHALAPYHPLAIAMWLLACGLHVFFLLTFAYHRLRDWHLQHMVPSWYVPPIGIVVAALTVTTTSLHIIGVIFVYFGLVNYGIMLPIMLYRLIQLDRVEPDRKATLAVLAAPPSLVLAGYLTAVHHPHPAVVAGLLTVALLMTTVVYMLIWKIAQQDFNPGFSAFTFPLVISATATTKACMFFNNNFWLHLVAQTEIAVATMIVVLVTYLYAKLAFIAGNNIIVA